MIKIIANRNNRSAIITLPSGEDELYRKCKEIQATDNYPPTAQIEEIIEPRELSFLEGKTVNLDELNYLSKQIECFYDGEDEQFYIALAREKPEELKGIINLTFNLDKYTLIQDIRNMTKVGREYVINTQGSAHADSKYDEHYAQIGRELLNSGRGIFTDKGILFIEDKPLEEVYDGQVFPSFAYNASIVEIDVEYHGKRETLFLPDSNIAFGKAINRLGASFLEDCRCTLDITDAKYEKLKNQFETVLNKEGVNELNDVLTELYENEIDAKKLSALIDYAEASSAHDIRILADNIDNLELIEDVNYGDYEAVGRFFIDSDCYDQYEISDDLLDFFDFADFGEHIADEKDGEFVSDGFVFYDGIGSVEDIRNQLDSDESMTIGGI